MKSNIKKIMDAITSKWRHANIYIYHSIHYGIFTNLRILLENFSPLNESINRKRNE